ncbi:MAG: hypothetical protein LBQ18_06230 [Campylobacteraceae bacterium]|nr:hypothetical protein [Campylobacteraceae bacterium]
MRTKLPFLLSALIVGSTMLSANEAKLPIKKISLFSSGVGYFERGGELQGDAKLTLPFEASAINDALKSLIVYDPATNAPLVSYASDELQKTLSSLKINLFGNPNIASILASLRGAEVEIYAPDKITGKIIGVETKTVFSNDQAGDESFLSLFTNNQIQVIALKEITSYAFTDTQISQDLSRALEIILNSKQNSKDLHIYLPSSKTRAVSIGYVIPAPVWKAAYRLDLTDKKPFFQGWAIVDNAGDTDWKDVELSLVVGRPVSFTQPLYTPYFLNRPVLPLSIAGFAQAQSYESGYKELAMADVAYEVEQEPMMNKRLLSRAANAPLPVSADYDVPKSQSAGEQFVFTLKNPITLERRQSAMFPFAQGNPKARKVSIFTHIPQGQSVNPALGAELTNDLGLKLPAGAISVYDGGSYAGDALIEFWGENEKRFISYGDDLALSGTLSGTSKTIFDSVKISKGVMQVSEKIVDEKIYSLKNSGKTDKNVILEHPFIYGAKLIEPAKYAEKTSSAYRFEFTLPANKELKYTVKEERPSRSGIRIADLQPSAIVAFSTNKNFPSSVKNALKEAAKLMDAIENEKYKLTIAKRALDAKINEQDRVRKNIEAVGNDSIQGKEYIKRLTALDSDIDKAYVTIDELEESVRKANQAFDNYTANLEI